MSANYKNFPFHLIGCAVLLLVGAYTQSVKAVLPDPSVVEMHWRQNPKIFQETFEMLFSQAESLHVWNEGSLHVWNEGFPSWIKDQNGNPCTVKTNRCWLSFHMLEKLKCNAELKEIIKVLGSTEFLEKVLSEEVVKSIFAHAISGKDFETEITFQPHLEENFFNMFGKSELRMRIEQFFKGSKVLDCDFSFAFEKKNRLTVLTNYDVSYAIGQGEEQRSTRVAFLKKMERLPDFPRNIPGNAKNKFSAVYAKLRDDLKNNRKEYKDFEICSDAEFAQKQLKKSINSFEAFEEKIEMYKKLSSNPMIMKYRDKISAMSDILITEDFLKGIFGEEFWNILAHYNMKDFYSSGLSVNFNVSPYGKGLKVSYSFYNIHRGNRTEDAVSFQNEAKEWEWINFNYINFVFFYDPEKDEISHVRLQRRLVLNYELIMWGDDLLTVDEDDFESPSSFWLEVQADDIVKHFRCVTGDGKITLGSVVNEINKTCYRFDKDAKSSIQILSQWAREKSCEYAQEGSR